MRSSLRLGRLLVGLGLSVNLGAAAAAGNWQVGTARVDITPRTPMWMAGYASRDHAAEGQLHPLWAKALAVRDPQGQRAVLITLDVCGIGRELSLPVRERIEKEHGLERSQVVLSCSHTHSGPVVGTNLLGMYPLDEAGRKQVEEYSAFLPEALVQVAREALSRLAPVCLSWGLGRCDFAVNRRNNNQAQAAELRARIALAGPVDHDVPVLAARDAEGRLVAAVVLYACHCTVLSGYQFSGDYAGFAQVALERDHPGAQAMFVAGCGGDQNPLPRGTVEQASAYGEQLAAAARRVLAGAMTPIEGALEARYAEIELAFGVLPDRAAWERDRESSTLAVANRAKAMLTLLDAGQSVPSTYPYPVQLWRLGSGLDWVFLGGEVTVDYALRLKRSLGSSRTVVAGYCNDVMAYIPSLRVLKEGGYEGGGAMVYYGQPSPWAEDVEERIVAAVRALIPPAPAQ